MDPIYNLQLWSSQPIKKFQKFLQAKFEYFLFVHILNVLIYLYIIEQGGHDTGKTDIHFSRQGKYIEFVKNIQVLQTRGQFWSFKN